MKLGIFKSLAFSLLLLPALAFANADLAARVKQVQAELVAAQVAVDGTNSLLNKQSMATYATALTNAFVMIEEVAKAKIPDKEKELYLLGETDHEGNVIEGKGGILVKMGVAFSQAFLHPGRDEYNDDAKITFLYQVRQGLKEGGVDIKSLIVPVWDNQYKFEPMKVFSDPHISNNFVQELRRERTAGDALAAYKDFVLNKLPSIDQNGDDSPGSLIKGILTQMIDKQFATKNFRLNAQRFSAKFYAAVGGILALNIIPGTPDLFLGRTYWSGVASAGIYLAIGAGAYILKTAITSGKNLVRLKELRDLLNDPNSLKPEMEKADKDFKKKGPGLLSCLSFGKFKKKD